VGWIKLNTSQNAPNMNTNHLSNHIAIRKEGVSMISSDVEYDRKKVTMKMIVSNLFDMLPNENYLRAPSKAQVVDNFNKYYKFHNES